MQTLAAFIFIAKCLAAAITNVPLAPDESRRQQDRLAHSFAIVATPEARVLHHYYLDALQGYYEMTLVSCPKSETETLLKSSRLPMDSLSTAMRFSGYRSAPDWGSRERIREIVESGQFLSGRVSDLERQKNFAVLIDRRDAARDFIYFEAHGG